MYTSGIEHTSNVYYSAVVDIRTILCTRQVRDEPTEAYYRIFEADISTDDLEKCSATTQMELNNVYENVDNEYATKRFQ